MEPAEKKVALTDLARTLGLSIGTVDRALHDRPGVNPMTRAKVLQMASTLGYKPNLAARALSSKKRTRVASVLPRDPGGFFAAVQEGILEEARAAEPAGLVIEATECPWLDPGEAEAIEAAIEEGVSGLIIAPGVPDAVRPAIRKASRIKIPVVCVATDAPGTERLTVVRADPHTSGALAAELLGTALAGRGVVAVITGSTQTVTHTEILRGFDASLRAYFPAMTCAAIVEAHDHAEEAYSKTLQLFDARAEIAGVYVSTSNSAGVLRALDELGRTGRVAVVTMDLFPEVARRLREGAVLASIYQRPRQQGQQAFRALYRFVTEGICPPAQTAISPQIVMRGNLHLFVNR
jgi:LacI family transcriptional regulator